MQGENFLLLVQNICVTFYASDSNWMQISIFVTRLLSHLYITWIQFYITMIIIFRPWDQTLLEYRNWSGSTSHWNRTTLLPTLRPRSAGPIMNPPWGKDQIKRTWKEFTEDIYLTVMHLDFLSRNSQTTVLNHCFLVSASTISSLEIPMAFFF